MENIDDQLKDLSAAVQTTEPESIQPSDPVAQPDPAPVEPEPEQPSDPAAIPEYQAVEVEDETQVDTPEDTSGHVKYTTFAR